MWLVDYPIHTVDAMNMSRLVEYWYPVLKSLCTSKCCKINKSTREKAMIMWLSKGWLNTQSTVLYHDYVIMKSMAEYPKAYSKYHNNVKVII